LVTPVGATWYYGRSWNRLKATYLAAFPRTYTIEDEVGTVFTSKVKIMLSTRN
jgi:hypothetical protein